MTFVWSLTTKNRRTAQLEAGRAQLIAIRPGPAFHRLSQALHEFPEMAQHFQRLHSQLSNHAGETVQNPARVGYATDVGPSPREALEAKLSPI